MFNITNVTQDKKNVRWGEKENERERGRMLEHAPFSDRRKEEKDYNHL